MSADLAPGMRVGRYQLLFRLGKGGMGEVWAARQTSGVALGFRKVVALKVLRSRELTSNSAVMFLDEAKAASALQHPAIVPTVDLGQDDDLLFIAMDLVQGPSLTSLLQRLVIDRGRMPPTLIAYLGTRLAGALDYAHSRAQYQGQPLRLVHRDVSPHNVLLDVHSGEVRLTDFGVARTSIQDHESRVGTVRGKPSYMAPEQVVGGSIDHRTDLFALGIVLYESACLKRLFGRQNPLKSMDAVIKHRPKPITDLVDNFPVPLWRVIERALQKDPKRRWGSAAEMQEALADVSRQLGATSPSFTLVQLVGKHFEPRTFDLEEKLREIEAQGGLPSDLTRVEPSLWPSDASPDPLAPEAIEAARTQYLTSPEVAPRPGSRPPSLPAAPSAPMPTLGLDATQALPSAPSQSVSGILPRARRTTGPAILLASAAVLLVVAAVGVTMQRDEPTMIAPLPPTAPPPPPKPVARAQPGPVRVSPPPPSKAAPAPPPEHRPKPAPRSHTRVVKRPKKSAPPPKVAPSSYEAVHRLLLRVKALDDVRGTTMIVTLAEAGRDNQAALDKLGREAREFLRSHGRAP